MAFRSAVQTTGTAGPINLPAGYQLDDILVAVWSSDFGGISMANTNWVQIDSTRSLTTDGHTISVWYRVVDGTETGKLTWTIGGGSDLSCDCMAFSGRSTSAPITAFLYTAESSGSSPITITLNAITAAAGDDVLALFMLDTTDGGGTWSGGSYTSGYAEAFDISNAWSSLFGAYRENVSGGTTGNVQGVATSSGGSAGYAGWLIALASSGGGPPATPDTPVDPGNTMFFAGSF